MSPTLRRWATGTARSSVRAEGSLRRSAGSSGVVFSAAETCLIS
ncbi:MAG TPA: hypothetical protein VEZ19_10720 [Rubrobacter sp.]|nr:hypothetical protein [Rubrobacter sp.]